MTHLVERLLALPHAALVAGDDEGADRVELEGGYRPGDLTSVRGGASNAILGLCSPGVIRTAAASLALAGRLAAGIAEVPGARVTQTPQANAVFAVLPAGTTWPHLSDHLPLLAEVTR